MEPARNLLTPRETQVLQAMIDNGGSIAAAASKLKLSTNTVRVHLSRSAGKLGTKHQGRLATILAAKQAGVVDIKQ